MNILNVEIKAKYNNPQKILKTLLNLNAQNKGVDHQIDSYFFCENGRLKLRQGQIENSLIFYQRENVEGLKESHIVLARIAKNDSILSVLKSSYGLKVEVDKKRNILFIDNAKFHIDEVKGLGSFVEIELIDEVGNIGKQKLTERLNHYLNVLEIQASDYIDVSYSDLLLEKNIYDTAHQFLLKTESILKKHSIKLELKMIDHLCYRVKNYIQYQEMKKTFSQLGEILISSQVGGREITTFRLHRPITYQNIHFDIIELPAPKEGSPYELGFEHAEFVIDSSFDVFLKNHSQLTFDTSAMNKKINPELKIKFSENISFKLHHRKLVDVIADELA
jgi:adenylate cyclase class 2